MNESSFTVHDASAFPIVRLRSGQASRQGYAPEWCREMDVLVESGTPFVLIYGARHGEESHDDRVARGLWLKRNKDILTMRCLALIVVEPDPGRRAEMEAAFPNLVRAFGAPQAARATDEDAVDLAQHLIAGGCLNAP